MSTKSDDSALYSGRIYILYKDYENYKLRLDRENPIRKLWASILEQAPAKLIKEISSKRTDLIRRDSNDFKITGAIPYQFETLEASKELAKYLTNFVVFVEHNTKEILEWKKEIKSKNYLRYEFFKSLSQYKI